MEIAQSAGAVEYTDISVSPNLGQTTRYDNHKK